jgi:hypothetical protein
MSNYTLKEGQGSLFKNNRKQTAQHPDYFGNLLVNGKEMRLGAWVIEGKNGKFFSLQLSEIQKTNESQAESTDDLPF